jgi:hypothetical protein
MVTAIGAAAAVATNVVLQATGPGTGVPWLTGSHARRGSPRSVPPRQTMPEMSVRS